MPSANKFMKNDRVEFEVGSRTVHGILTDLSDGLRVVADGGKLCYTVPSERLRFSTRKLPKDPPHACDVWQLSSYRVTEGNDGRETVVATVSLDCHPALIITSRRDGSPCRTAPMNGDYNLVASFRQSIREWLGDHQIVEGEVVDEEDFWVDFKAHKAPFGVTTGAAIAEYFQGFDEARTEVEAQDESFKM